MATNDFLPFAITGSPNVLSQAAYAALAARSGGFVAGIANSAELNKVWRQAAFMTAGWGEWIKSQSVNALDDATLANIVASIDAALAAKIAATATAGRTRLSANKNYYIATTGDDTTGTGLIGAPWLTLQKAINVIHDTVDLNGFTATINVAAGTYSSATTLLTLRGEFIGNGLVKILGDTTTPGNCVFNCTGGGANFTFNLFRSTLSIAGIKILSGATGCYIAEGSKFYVDGNCEFGTCGGGGNVHLLALGNSQIIVNSNYIISGGSGYHFVARAGAQIITTLAGLTTTVTGAPNFIGAFAQAETLGGITLVNAMTYSGAATGKIYNAFGNGAIQSATTTFPGNVAGTTATGGQYI